MLKLNYSYKSLQALNALQKHEDSLIQIEQKIIYIENTININNYISLIDRLAQLNGDIDKIQYEGIDSIITADLNSGKIKIKNIRKYLNSKCEIIRKKIIDIHTFLNQLKPSLQV